MIVPGATTTLHDHRRTVLRISQYHIYQRAGCLYQRYYTIPRIYVVALTVVGHAVALTAVGHVVPLTALGAQTMLPEIVRSRWLHMVSVSPLSNALALGFRH